MVARVSTRTTAPEQTTDQQKQFFGQPRVLGNLFGVEMWERFSFYGMQGILLIYLYYSASQGGLGISTAVATGIVGAYGGAVYLSTILGAWISDRVIGPERTLFYSAIVVMFGHISLSLIPGLGGVGVGLVLVALGSGGVKANATALVGSLYAEDDDRRDAGFSIFYMGINLGALVGPLLTGLLQSDVGFHAGFALAAIGMFFGLVQYSIGRKNLPEETHHVPHPLTEGGGAKFIVICVVALAAVVGLLVAHVVDVANLATVVAWVSGLAALVYFVAILTSKEITDIERRRVYAFIPMFIASTVFWSLYQQQFTVVTIYSDKRLDRHIFGWEMPVSWVQSINPIFIIVLAGVFAAMWTKLGDRQPSTPTKFALGTISIGLSFLAFIPMAGGGAHSAPLLGLVGVLLLFTISELLLSPVGLSLATKLAPAKFNTQMVALFFLSIALGTALSGLLSGYYNPNNEVPYFLKLGIAAIVVGVVLFAFVKPIRKLMSGVH
jgi:POT family proton-dependent oligopeptide transporter